MAQELQKSPEAAHSGQSSQLVFGDCDRDAGFFHQLRSAKYSTRRSVKVQDCSALSGRCEYFVGPITKIVFSNGSNRSWPADPRVNLSLRFYAHPYQ
jgi:hypothetical protein